MDEKEKWNIKNKKGYVEIHVAVDVKTNKKILSMMKVTADEHVHDSKMLPGFVENIIESEDMLTTIGKIFGDGAYDNNDAFRYPSDMESCHVLK